MERIIDTAHQSTTLLASSLTSFVTIISIIIIIAITIRSSFGERPVDESDVFNKAGTA